MNQMWVNGKPPVAPKPAIVIPNRTRRWFHDWKPGVDLIGQQWPFGGRMLTVDLPGDPLALYFHADPAMPYVSWCAVPGVSEHISGRPADCDGFSCDDCLPYGCPWRALAIGLTGIPEAYGTCEEFPRTDSGVYMGISREGYGGARTGGKTKCTC